MRHDDNHQSVEDEALEDGEDTLLLLGRASVETRGGGAAVLEITGFQPQMGAFED